MNERMNKLDFIKELLQGYRTVKGGCAFFRALGYPCTEPLPWGIHLPKDIADQIAQVLHLGQVGGRGPFRIFQVALKGEAFSRYTARRFLERFYGQEPQGEALFVFTPQAEPYKWLAFVSPRRIFDPAKGRVKLWLRILQVDPLRPYRTDLETLAGIDIRDLRAASPAPDPEEVWGRHEKAFSVQRVTEGFFRDYNMAFGLIQQYLRQAYPQYGPGWARDYTHQLLNRIMFLYFIARKGWLLGPDGKPDRDFMGHFWEAYRKTGAHEAFHREWLRVLFFETFNLPPKGRKGLPEGLPPWLAHALRQAPYLNGGLYAPRPGLDWPEVSIPDQYFALLFEKWVDGTFPGFFERYNFTVVESGRFDEEVAVDPEMLGTVYERLVNLSFEGEEEENSRGEAGIFYTPRVEIDLMSRLALVDWLAKRLGEDKKDLLYRFVFAFSEEERKEAEKGLSEHGLWEELEKELRRVRVLDPACGSGAFLVGMMLVLDELQARCNALLGKDETPYERRKRILQEQLYGVDVMEWAVRVAELRLWLQLVVETELKEAELHSRPLLPNLDLKLRPGDSLLQTVGEADFSLFRRKELRLPPHLKGRLEELKDKKRRYFQGGEARLTAEDLRREELQFFREILSTEIQGLKERIRRLQRRRAEPGELFMGKNPKQAKDPIAEEIAALKKKRAYYERLLDSLSPENPPPFVWDLSFAEVFEGEDPGFDIVIGNPPYVRQEKIKDHLGRFGREEYLRRLNESLRRIYPSFLGKKRQISGRADYYVYFYLHALSLLAERGTFCFITSNSWLDVDFGKDLQEFFLRHGHLKMVIDNHAKRSFGQADVNTVIVLAGPPERERALGEEEMRARKVRFVAFRVPFEEALSPILFSEIEDDRLYTPLAGFQVLNRREFRAVLLDQWALWEGGLEEEDDEGLLEAREYAGDKWGGKYLRAPDIFFTLLEKGKGKLVRLGDIAEVRRGFTTGANDFFYLEPVGMTVKEVAELREKDPKAPVRVRNGAGWEGEIEAAWLRPVIKSPREIKTLRVRLEDLRYLIFMPPDDVRKAIEAGSKTPWDGYPLAEAYIRWGEGKRYSQRPTCASRQWWWDVGLRQLPTVVWVKSVDDNHRQAFVPFDALVDQRLYELRPENPRVIAALMNSIPFLLAKELTSRVNLGEGALDTAVYEANATLILTPLVLGKSQTQGLFSTFDRLAQRGVRSIFEELGFPLCRQRRCQHPEHPYEFVKPEALTLEQVRHASPDRFELDEVVFDALGLTQEERLQVYQAVAQLVKDRLAKARSV